jgi:hypothetical protein
MDKTGLLVCEECWDPDHPQNHLGREPVNDPQALRNPRPDKGLSNSREIGQVYDFSNGEVVTKIADQDRHYFYNKEIIEKMNDNSVGSYNSNTSNQSVYETGPYGNYQSGGTITYTTREGDGLGNGILYEGVPKTFYIRFDDYVNLTSTMFTNFTFSFERWDYYEPLIAGLPRPGYDNSGTRIQIRSGGEHLMTRRITSNSNVKYFSIPSTQDRTNMRGNIVGMSENWPIEITATNTPHGRIALETIATTISYIKPPASRQPEWQYDFYGLDDLYYIAIDNANKINLDGVPDENVMTQDSKSLNAIVTPSPIAVDPSVAFPITYSLDCNGSSPREGSASEVNTFLYKKVELRMRFIKPSSIGKSEFDGTREWVGRFEWVDGIGGIGEGGRSVTVPEPDLLTLYQSEPDWVTITWDIGKSSAATLWEDVLTAVGWRMLLYKYTPSSGTQQPDSFEISHIKFIP